MKKILCILSFLLTTSAIYANSGDTLHTSFFPHIGYPIGVGAEDFFGVYKTELGGKQSVMKPTPVFGVGSRYVISDVSRVGLLFSYYQADFNEGFFQKIYPKNPDSPERLFTEKIVVKNKIFFLTYEYSPYMGERFNSYIGLRAGVNASHLYWYETVVSPIKNDIRRSGTRIDRTIFSPITGICLGLELAWDEKYGSKILGNLILEASYIHDFRYIRMFEDFRDQFDPEPDFADKRTAFVTGFFTFHIAVSIDMYREF